MVLSNLVDEFNTSVHNRLWVHYEDVKEYFPTVCIDKVQWLQNGKSIVILKGFLLKDRFLLDIHKKRIASFEVLTAKCGDPRNYEQGKRLMIAKNPTPVRWWTDDVMSLEENQITHLYCQFTCDWVEICEP